MRRPEIPDELCERIDKVRGGVAFQRYVRTALAVVVAEDEGQNRAQDRIEAQAPIEPTPLPKFAPRRS